MNVSDKWRILNEYRAGASLRAHYWGLSKTLKEITGLRDPRNRAFRKIVVDNYRRYLFGVTPIRGHTWRHAQAALDWLKQAQDATPDGGVSYGYFPTSRAAGWDVSYPETTGYIMTSFVDCYRRTGDEAALARALRMADWEVDVQMQSGAVQGGKLCPPDRQSPASFNTGMVLDGWCSVHRVKPSRRIFAAARRAADFLVEDMDKEGYFRTNGPFVSRAEVKTYNCLCAWAMYRFGEESGEERYREAAIKAVEAALRKQKDNGWFADNCLTRPAAPLTHTIGYTLQGILEVGILAGRNDFVAAARKGVEPLIMRISRDGFVNGRFYGDWRPAVLSCCLTGSAQLAVVCYRLDRQGGESAYVQAADRIVDYLKALQVLDSTDPGVNGALAGSFPIYAGYMSGGYPNWATKYLLDALMLQADARQA
jgi:hypothetical protein